MPTRVLIVDDDADLLGVLQEALESDAFIVDAHQTVQTATRALAENPFDVVLTDLALAGTGGLAFCGHIASLPSAPPVLVMTGHPEARSAALRLGARRVLVKPVEIDDLKQALREITAPTAGESAQ